VFFLRVSFWAVLGDVGISEQEVQCVLPGGVFGKKGLLGEGGLGEGREVLVVGGEMGGCVSGLGFLLKEVGADEVGRYELKPSFPACEVE